MSSILPFLSQSGISLHVGCRAWFQEAHVCTKFHTCAQNTMVFFFQIFVRLKPVAEKEMYQLMKAFLLKPKDRQQLLQQLTPVYYLKVTGIK